MAAMVRDRSLSTRDAESPRSIRDRARVISSFVVRRYFAVFPGMMYIPRGTSKEGSLKDIQSRISTRCAPYGRTRVSPEPMET